MTCCFSVGHFHIHLPLAGYICRWQTMLLRKLYWNRINISLCSHPNYKRDCEEWNLKLHFFTAPWTATTIQLKNHRSEKNSPRGCFLVPVTGLEPVRSQWPRDFKSLVSAYSTTAAKNSLSKTVRKCRNHFQTQHNYYSTFYEKSQVFFYKHTF